MTPRKVEIVCSACGADTIVRREPVYEGFKKTGEKFICSSCGHEYAGEQEVPFKGRKQVKVFTDADKSRKVEVFDDSERGRNCRYCKNYVVNPFTQMCGLHLKKVQATDYCDSFERKEEKPPEQKPT